MKSECGPIGIFDSGYGGLTILREIRKIMPQYDYLYLGDNARTPYGTRSFDVVYEFTIQAVRYLFKQGCHPVRVRQERQHPVCKNLAGMEWRRTLGVVHAVVWLKHARCRMVERRNEQP